MASTLGVQHDPMMAAIRSAVAPVDGLPAVIAQDTIPRDLMSHLTNHLAALRDGGHFLWPTLRARRPQVRPFATSSPTKVWRIRRRRPATRFGLDIQWQLPLSRPR